MCGDIQLETRSLHVKVSARVLENSQSPNIQNPKPISVPVEKPFGEQNAESHVVSF